jgi:hypothetical protein
MQSTATAPIGLLPAYSHCRRAAKLKMLCITGNLGTGTRPMCFRAQCSQLGRRTNEFNVWTEYRRSLSTIAHSQEIENQRLIRNIHHYVKFAPIGDSWSFGSTCWVANSICSDP